TGPTLTYTGDVAPAHGSVTGLGAAGNYTYTPDPDFDGTDTFTLKVDDGHSGSDTIAVDVTMVPAEDAPVFDGTGNSGTGNEETLITGTVHATDPDTGDTLAHTIESGNEPGNGTASVDPATGGWTYTGDNGFTGNDQFTVTVSDGNGGTDTEVVSLTVTPANSAPVID